MNTSTRLHRRTDWALLLPPLDVAEALVAGQEAEETGRALTELGLARRWRPLDGTPVSTAALVVARPNGSVDVAALADRVRAGGTLLVEVDRTVTARAPTVRQAVATARAHGLQVLSTHWISPDLDQPRRYLPLDRPEAIAWHLRTLFVAATLGQRMARTTMLAAMHVSPWRAARVVRRMCRRYVLVATRPAGDGRDVVDAPATGALVLTSGHDTASRSVVVPLAAGALEPEQVLKLTHGPASTATDLEQRRTAMLRAHLPPSLAEGIPAPGGTTTWGGFTVHSERCVPGCTLQVATGLWGRGLPARARDLRSAARWLTAFGVATKVAVDPSDPVSWPSWLRRAAHDEALEPATDALLRELDARSRRSAVARSAVHVHGDAGPWNVYVAGPRVSVIDWEVDPFDPTDCLGPPLSDVLYLVSYWYFQVCRAKDREAEARAVVRLFADRRPADAAVAAARAVLDECVADAGLRRDDVPVLLAALWTRQTFWTRRRRVQVGDPAGEPVPPSQAYLDALAAARRSLLDPDGWWGRRPRPDEHEEDPTTCHLQQAN